MHPEQTTLERARLFDERALAEIYDRYSPGIYRYAWRLLGDVDLAEECAADTFRRFLEALKGGGGPQDHLQAYLYRTAHNWVSDHYRRRPAPALGLENLQIADPAPEPSQAAQAEERREELRRALSSLTPDQRQVLVLKYLEDWSNAEIAQALEKPVGAVKALRNRGIQALRRYLLKNDSESEMI